MIVGMDITADGDATRRRPGPHADPDRAADRGRARRPTDARAEAGRASPQ
jgi:hypothetical protein